MFKTINLSHPRKAFVDNINNSIFEAKLKDIKFYTYPTIISCIMGFILLTPDYAYAKDAAQKSTEVINNLSMLGPPTLLTAVELYKVRASIKMYIKNLKLYLHEPIKST